jgi:predicted lactoylglutathione lyase
MARKIFVNLPIKNLADTTAFFTKLGFTFNQQFTDENATCMVVSEDIFVMLLVEPFFSNFIKKPIADAKAVTEVILALSAESRAEVDDIVEKAIAAGGRQTLDPQDHGWMYQRSFEDINGHQWEFAYMDEAALAAQRGQP